MKPVRVVNPSYLVIQAHNDGSVSSYSTDALGVVRLLAAERGAGFNPIFPAAIIPCSTPAAFQDEVREAMWRHRPK